MLEVWRVVRAFNPNFAALHIDAPFIDSMSAIELELQRQHHVWRVRKATRAYAANTRLEVEAARAEKAAFESKTLYQLCCRALDE